MVLPPEKPCLAALHPWAFTTAQPTGVSPSLTSCPRCLPLCEKMGRWEGGGVSLSKSQSVPQPKPPFKGQRRLGATQSAGFHDPASGATLCWSKGSRGPWMTSGATSLAKHREGRTPAPFCPEVPKTGQVALGENSQLTAHTPGKDPAISRSIGQPEQGFGGLGLGDGGGWCK